MFEVAFESAKALLIIKLAGKVTPQETELYLEDVRKLATEFKPGFSLLTDMSELESMDVACAPYIRKIMDLLNRKGIDRVVRIIPDPHKDIGFKIMSLFHYRKGVKLVTCQTVAEAKQVLAA